ncbi:CRISPR-associated helicase Cas3' [Brevibacillus agri]|uniref:CRISPR-associated helicase Cas3' n=1 Tax=Brevibacillus agri TaxID=51101 RepID=UPI002E1D9EE8|nr:CRISPR-associated helicase Cas3' [Brevibacillus agri]MED1653260.1 CRISPR-associated helicase Cas3' [Brevibacillus agri]MED1687874.1 CRISPR-associated helicase Cas3' [Brevibacillus agri]MED1695354.1 CRISPR-associated helicase Cas3' [Brevibacillus agri]MED1696329.1 CRISPR-associated helicase Cas3' [Brevibacillus agri]
MKFIAHIRESDKQIQSVAEHLLGVKALAESIGEKIGVKHIAGLAGMLHDMGKYTEEFKDYIIKAVENPGEPPKRGSVDHSTAGGRLLYQKFHTGNPSRGSWILAEVVGNAIISHHSYLHDFLNADLESPYLHRVRDKPLKEYDKSIQRFFDEVISEQAFHQYVLRAIDELEAYLNKPSVENSESKLMFLTKFVFSALIDADRTNTRLFEENKHEESTPCRQDLFHTYYERLMKKLHSYQEKEEAKTRINELRKELSDQCDKFAEKPSGIYTLSIPTGGGKTLASLRYALKHAIRENKKHIIYVVPFTTIIEQNAEEVRKILMDDEHILEHHSNVIDDMSDDDEDQDGIINTRQKWKLAKDNWDSPIIFTTMVQFLNVFYARGSRNIRRLHNLCESVIIFDEVQKIPVSCVSLFNHALNFLKSHGHSSLILCTATQPALDFVERRLEISADSEMIQNVDHVIEAFKRVEIVDKATDETFDTDKLADFITEKIEEVQSILVVLNTKTVVKRLYRQMETLDIPLYHLSTSMCAAHRNHILGQVRDHLQREEKVICISTQLIEAGVDVSFDCVIRSLAGLDSIAQAAGRCNRHGEKEIQQVYVIDHAEENLNHLQEIKAGKKLSKRILIDLKTNPNLHGGNLLSVQAMDKYFKEFYTEFRSRLDYFIRGLEKHMTELLMANRNNSSYNCEYTQSKRESLPLFIVNSYRTAADFFQVIDDQTTTVLVPYGEEGKEMIARLNGDETIENLSRLLRKAQQYSINLFSYEREQLVKNDGLVSLLDGKILALKESAYSGEYGLDIENDSQFEMSMF